MQVPESQTVRSASLSLNHKRPIADCSLAHQIADPQPHMIAAAQLAADGKIKECAIAEATFLLEPKQDGLHFLLLQSTLRAHLPSGVPS